MLGWGQGYIGLDVIDTERHGPVCVGSNSLWGCSLCYAYLQVTIGSVVRLEMGIIHR